MRLDVSINRSGKASSANPSPEVQPFPVGTKISVSPSSPKLDYLAYLLSVNERGRLMWIDPSSYLSNTPVSKTLVILGTPDSGQPQEIIGVKALFLAELLGVSDSFTEGNRSYRSAYLRLYARPGQAGPYAAVSVDDTIYNVKFESPVNESKSILIVPSHNGLVSLPGEQSIPTTWGFDKASGVISYVIPGDGEYPDEGYRIDTARNGVATLSTGRSTIVDPVADIYVSATASTSVNGEVSILHKILSLLAVKTVEAATSYVWSCLLIMAQESVASVMITTSDNFYAPDFEMASAGGTIVPAINSIYHLAP